MLLCATLYPKVRVRLNPHLAWQQAFSLSQDIYSATVTLFNELDHSWHSDLSLVRKLNKVISSACLEEGANSSTGHLDKTRLCCSGAGIWALLLGWDVSLVAQGGKGAEPLLFYLEGDLGKVGSKHGLKPNLSCGQVIILRGTTASNHTGEPL